MSERFTLHLGDCLAVLPTLEAESVDAVVTDPPYHLTSISRRFGKASSAPVADGAGVFARKAKGFMGKAWDGGDVAFRPETWAAVMRVMKPGAHLVAFGGSRTSHRMACAIEDAGFELRDTLMWIYGSGFPKSLDLAKGIDKAMGAQRDMVRVPAHQVRNHKSAGQLDTRPCIIAAREAGFHETASSEAKTAAAAAAQGLGTALKPAFEPIILARVPLRESSIVRQYLATGTGAINIAACRIRFADEEDKAAAAAAQRLCRADEAVVFGGFGNSPDSVQGYLERIDGGRWPANILHDGSEEATHFMGAARRYFYSAKADREDREEGLEDAEEKTLQSVNPGGLEHDPRWAPVKRRNVHPTVKSTDLMRWLCRLVVPRGGLVLDPFMGSGSTGKAAMLEGFRFTGIEMDPEYLEIARKRIEDGCRDWAERSARRAEASGQASLWGSKP